MHLLLAALASCISLGSSDTTRSATDTAAVFYPAGVTSIAISDTVRPRRKAVEIDQGYELRLRIHRYASYSTIPLFALQTIAGNQLYVNGGSNGAPGWASTTHSLGAAGLGALFTLNTVTGVWNLWNTRDQPDGRTKRFLHSALMLASDAGFAYTGIALTSDLKNSADARTRHRDWAYGSMGVALAGYGVMLIGDH